MVNRTLKVPSESIIADGFGRIDYVDSYSVPVGRGESVDRLVTKILCNGPAWVDKLMALRDAVVGCFGLKTASKEGEQVAEFYEVGARASLFTVISRNEREIVMGEEDRHLVFRASVLVTGISDVSFVHVTTIVRFNNIWGRLYFLPVKPFHRLIVASSVRGVERPVLPTLE
jgi:hypothetical protein